MQLLPLPQMRARPAAWPLLAAACLGATACAHRATETPGALRFSAEVRELLAVDPPSAELYDARRRLTEMGPEVDGVLVALARDARARPVARANALILLAERQSPAAIPVLRRVLLTEEVEMLRSAAVLGLQRLSSHSDSARSLIRSAAGDPARTVRLNVLQALDIGEVATIRAMLPRESDREVRTVALQLIAMAESRGAPLAPDRRGALRTAAAETDPQLVFRPARVDSVGRYAVGDLRVELPVGPDIPLTSTAEVVANVVPAFFSADRSRVVFEADREVRVLDLASREARSLGPGIAPRLVPFTHHFVFLREQPQLRRETDAGTELFYEVFRASFADGAPEMIGELRAVARTSLHANYSPVRWMVVGETPEGFVLQGEGITPFALPSPVWRSAPAEQIPAAAIPLPLAPRGGPR